MEPTWTSDCGTVRLWLGDCLEVMQSWPDGSVDAIVTDPPYSSGGAFRGDRMASPRVKYVSSDASHNLHTFTGDNRDQRSYLAWCSMWMCVATHISRHGALLAVFTDWRQLPVTTDAIQAGGWVYRGIATWQKVNARPVLGRYTNQCEFIPWGTNGPRDATAGGTTKGWIVSGSPSAEVRQHITEKPVEVMEWLLEPTANGDTIADPFMGSGTTGVAAVRLGRQFWGVEIDPEYFETAKRRIKDELRRAAFLEGDANGKVRQLELGACNE